MESLVLSNHLLASLIGVAKQWTPEDLQAKFGLAAIAVGSIKGFWGPLVIAVWAAAGRTPGSISRSQRSKAAQFDSGSLSLLAWALVADVLLLRAWNRIDTVLIFEALLQSVTGLALLVPLILIGALRGRAFVRPVSVAVAVAACACVVCCYSAVVWLIYPFLRA